MCVYVRKDCAQYAYLRLSLFFFAVLGRTTLATKKGHANLMVEVSVEISLRFDVRDSMCAHCNTQLYFDVSYCFCS
jgi:hypothetical protein